MPLIVFLLIVGIVLVVKGGDFFVDAASWIAEVSGIPKLIIGATVVSVATTLPEMLVSVLAAAQGKVDMSIGNAVGSVTANIGLIMAISLICMPGIIKRGDYWKKTVLMLSASVILVICGAVGQVNLIISCLLIGIFALFLWENVSSLPKPGVKERETAPKAATDKKTVCIQIAKFIFGAAFIVIGADLLVDNGSELARMFGISERIVGVTLMAVGTSLPELITTVTAVIKKENDLSVGNILGANIMDLTLIMPLSSLIAGKALPVSHLAAVIDLPAALLVGVLATVPALIGGKFYRRQGILLLAVYGGYVALTCIGI